MLRRKLAWSATLLAATFTLFGSMAVTSASDAEAEDLASNFCAGWLDPAWTGNYRCDSPDSISGYNRRNVMITNWERAGCVDYADVWHNLVASWVCYPKGTELGGIKVRQDGGWYRGAIRNNNSTYRAQFTGTIMWSQ